MAPMKISFQIVAPEKKEKENLLGLQLLPRNNVDHFRRLPNPHQTY